MSTPLLMLAIFSLLGTIGAVFIEDPPYPDPSRDQDIFAPPPRAAGSGLDIKQDPVFTFSNDSIIIDMPSVSLLRILIMGPVGTSVTWGGYSSGVYSYLQTLTVEFHPGNPASEITEGDIEFRDVDRPPFLFLNFTGSGRAALVAGNLRYAIGGDYTEVLGFLEESSVWSVIQVGIRGDLSILKYQGRERVDLLFYDQSMNHIGNGTLLDPGDEVIIPHLEFDNQVWVFNRLTQEGEIENKIRISEPEPPPALTKMLLVSILATIHVITLSLGMLSLAGRTVSETGNRDSIIGRD